MTCTYCGSTYAKRTGADALDFVASPEYCTIACENAHGEYVALRERDVARARLAHYHREHMLESDWREHLPVGDHFAPEGYDYCRNCARMIEALRVGAMGSDTEFCSALCAEDFHLAHSRWLRETGRDTGADVALPTPIRTQLSESVSNAA